MGAAAVVLGWGVATWAIVDHLLYVQLLGGRMRMHPLPLLVAILGGLATFGVSGLVLGPVILAVTEAFLDVWRRRRAGPSQAAPDGELLDQPAAKDARAEGAGAAW